MARLLRASLNVSGYARTRGPGCGPADGHVSGASAGRWRGDLGGDWGHELRVEKMSCPKARMKYPRCLAGARVRGRVRRRTAGDRPDTTRSSRRRRPRGSSAASADVAIVRVTTTMMGSLPGSSTPGGSTWSGSTRSWEGLHVDVSAVLNWWWRSRATGSVARSHSRSAELAISSGRTLANLSSATRETPPATPPR